MKTLKIAKFIPDAILPTRKHPTDAGIDLYALEDTLVSERGIACIVRTGITIEIPKGYCAQLWPKGRSNYLVGAGIVDEGYTGEILIKVINSTDAPYLITRGDATAQLVLVKIITPEVEEISSDLVHKTTQARINDGIVNQI